MKQPFRGLALTHATLLLLGASASAQIHLITGPQYAVPQSPQFIATADFDRDGIADVAVTDSATSGLVSVLLAASDGPFHSRASVSVGHELLGVAAGDLNCDGSPDIAVVDGSDNLFVITGNGDGTFNQPATYLTGKLPIDVAIGNFDGESCADVAVLNQADRTLSIFLNLGHDRGFAVREFAVGLQPRRLRVADLDGNGLDDTVVIGPASDDSDAITVLMNAGDGSFSTPRTFSVKLGAVDLAVADFNNDTVPDIAVLHAERRGGGPASSVSVLLQRTQTGGSGRVGTGVFETGVGIEPVCPARMSMVPVVCNPTSMAGADYDQDGLLDLAISFSTRPIDASAEKTPGFISAFAGRGDGTFDFTTQVLVGPDPTRIVAADFNADGIPDIGVAEGGSSSLRVLRSAYPPIHPPEVCRLGTQCLSGFCVDGVCCATGPCPAGELCNITGHAGACAPPAVLGAPCSSGQQCQSGFCVDGFCCDSKACGDGLFCNSGTCTPPAPPGTPCFSEEQCQSRLCTDGICCPFCASNEFCQAGLCTRLPSQPRCLLGAQCSSGCCIYGFCQATTACGATASLTLSTPTGGPADHVSLEVTLNTHGALVAGVQNDITFDAGALIAANANGRPDCLVNATINKNATSFRFRPPGCTPGVDCTSFRTLVLSTDNVDPIQDGALLYTCAVRIGDETPPGSYPLAVSGQIASDPNGNQVGFSTVDGAVIVVTPPGATPLPTWTVSPAPSPKPPTATYTPFPTSTVTPTSGPTYTPRPSVVVSIGSASARPDDSVAVAVRLTSGAFPVAGVQADIIVDTGISIAVRPSGKPDCQVNPDINEPATGFSFLPPRCTPGVSCMGMRALVLAVDNVDPIPDGVVLYTCRVHVGSDTPPGNYAVQLLSVVASDPNGEAWGVVVKHGEIVVVTPSGATPIPTWTPGPVVIGVPPASPAGEACDPSDPAACTSGFCVDAMCCDSGTCPEGQRCDISGFEGTCAPPLPESGYCRKQTDCAAGFVCGFDPLAGAFLCAAPPLPTPTFVPFTPQPTDRGPLSSVSGRGVQGSGCAVDPAHEGGLALAVLVLPPGLLLLRRRRARAAFGAGCAARGPMLEPVL